MALPSRLLVGAVVLCLHPLRRFVVCRRSARLPLSLQATSGVERAELCLVFQGARNVVESFEQAALRNKSRCADVLPDEPWPIAACRENQIKMVRLLSVTF